MANKVISSKPMKIWIDGKIFPIHSLSIIGKESNKKQEGDDEDNATNFSHEEHHKLLDIAEDDGKFTTNIKVPKLYYSKIKNLPYFSIEKVSVETGTKILFPKLGLDSGISLHSDTAENVAKAARHIHSALGEIRERNVPLQFTCIPCRHLNIQERFKNLKREILTMEPEIKGLHESIFMCPLKLHLTIDVYAFLDDTEKEEAIKALNEYKSTLEEILKQTGPLKLDIGTLDIMNDDIKNVNVLYANVKILNESDDHSLQKIVNGISEHFYHRGLAKRYQENVKLHMTVVNTKYRKNLEYPRRKYRQSIDATKIMEKFKDYTFGHCDFDSVHLSHISMRGDDGFYKPIAVLKLNEDVESEQ